MPPVHDLDPVALSIGPLDIHWYGISYLVAFLTGWWLGVRRARHQGWRGWTGDQVGDMLTFVIIGTLIGGRVGYMLFYQLDAFLANPLTLFNITQGGMSFHGGFIGVALALVLFARRTGKNYWAVCDFIAPLFPLGIGAVRVGNFINGELWGRPTDVPWAMVFPGAGDQLARHPSPLYQAMGEGLLLFVLLWWFSNKPRPRFAVTGFFLAGYGVLRSVAEFFREPDAHIGYLAGDWLTMGILLSQPLVILGAAFLIMAYRLKIDDTSGTKTTEPKKGTMSGRKNSRRTGRK